MKFKTTILFSALAVMSINSFSQSLIGIYGDFLKPVNSFSKNGYKNSGGFEIRYLSPLLFGEKTSMPFNLRAGLDFDWDFAGRKKFRDMVLDNPQGEATVKYRNQSIAFGAVIRITPGKVNEFGWTPYLDLNAGVRGFLTSRVIKPEVVAVGYESSTSDNIYSSGVLAYGFTLGCTKPLNNDVQFDVGVGYSTSSSNANYIPLNTYTRESNNVNYAFKQSHADRIFIKAGFLFTIRETNCRRTCASRDGEIITTTTSNDLEIKPSGAQSKMQKNKIKKPTPTPKPAPKLK